MSIEATEESFQVDVLDRSHEVPVVVDFWASWCAPCRQLSPALEKAAGAREGEILLAKVDVDQNPRLAQSFGVQGIPAVKAFRNGEVVSEFTGAIPPVQVEQFMDRLVPSEAERLAAQGDEASLRRAVELEPGRADAAVPLARMLLERGEREEAERVLEPVHDDFAADGLRSRLRLEDAGDPGLDAALRALDEGREEEALDALIAALGSADGLQDEVRQVVVGILHELGPEDPRTRTYRRKLASALF